MLKRLLVFGYMLWQTNLPQHFRAYQVSSHGANVIVDADNAQYVTCDVQLKFDDKSFLIGSQRYNVYNKKKADDSMVTFFGYRAGGFDKIACSATILPEKEKGHWMVLYVWEDSTKAFHTIAKK